MKRYGEAGRAGCVQLRRSKHTGTLVGIYHAAQAEIAADETWVTVCEEHGTLCDHQTLQRARWHAPAVDWCEECREALERGKALDLEVSTFRFGR